MLPDLYFAEGLDSSSVLTTHWENLNINRSKLPGKSKFKRRKNNNKNFEYFLEGHACNLKINPIK